MESGKDPIDGSDLNAVRRRALELMARSDDDLSDAEIFAREANDEYWFVALCLDSLHRLPSEVAPLLGCREYTTLQAYHIVEQAMRDMVTQFRDT